MLDYKIHFDLLSPVYVKVFEYKGPNPSKILKEVKNMMLTVTKVDSAGFYIDSLKWDIMGDPIKFFGTWRSIETKDARSKLTLLLKAQGEESIKEKQGSLTIWIRYTMIVDIPCKNIIDRSFAVMNTALFYKKRVKQYQETARRDMEDLEDLLRSMFELISKTKI